MGLGKDHSQNFDAQVFAATVSFLRYVVLSQLNEAENTGSKGILFEHLADEAAQITYVQRLWQFFSPIFVPWSRLSLTLYLLWGAKLEY